MTISISDSNPLVSASYAVLRHEGCPAERARLQLGLRDPVADRLERLFRSRPGGGAEAMRPRFAKHAEHVAAVLAAGGYPALPERPR